MAYRRKWLSASKILDHYVLNAPGVTNLPDAKYQLYYAVLEGEIRGRIDDKPLNSDTISRIRHESWGDDPSDLPADLMLSVEDAEEIWPSPELTDAELKGLVQRKFKVLEDILECMVESENGDDSRPPSELEDKWLAIARLAEIQCGKIQYSHLRETLRKGLEQLQERFDQISKLEPCEDSQSLASAAEADHYKTGFPGRPTIKHFIEQEFMRRASKGDALPTLAGEANFLMDWARKEHPKTRTPTEKTIKNNIRDLYNQHVRSRAQN